MSATFIAEIKTQSPFGFKSTVPFISLMEYAIKYGDWISVHTNPLWGGGYDVISFVRQFTDKPILAKGIHGTDDDIRMALDHGANYVLVVDRVPDFRYVYRDKILLEFSKLDDVRRIANRYEHLTPKPKFVYNSRDLRTGLPKMVNELEEVVKLGWTCQASNIISPADVNPNVQAFIVGECLIDYCQHL